MLNYAVITAETIKKSRIEIRDCIIIIFSRGLHAYEDINENVKETMIAKNPDPKAIQIKFDPTTFKYQLRIQAGYIQN